VQADEFICGAYPGSTCCQMSAYDDRAEIKGGDFVRPASGLRRQ
jgi:hypothetical protein